MLEFSWKDTFKFFTRPTAETNSHLTFKSSPEYITSHVLVQKKMEGQLNFHSFAYVKSKINQACKQSIQHFYKSFK